MVRTQCRLCDIRFFNVTKKVNFEVCRQCTDCHHLADVCSDFQDMRYIVVVVELTFIHNALRNGHRTATLC